METVVSLVNDVFALYVSGDLDMSIALQVLKYLDKEKSPIVWDSVISGFQLLQLEGASCNMTKHLYWEWTDFIKQKLPFIYNSYFNNLDENPDIRLFRYKLMTFAAEINYDPCVTYLRHMYQDTRRGKRILDPDVRQGCYYILWNDTTHFPIRKLSGIEEEDKKIVEHRLLEKKRFFIRLPYGEPRPLPIISTETPISSSLDPISGSQVMPSSAVINMSSMTLIVASIWLFS